MKLIVSAHTDINLIIHVNGKTGKGERKFLDRFIAQHMDYVMLQGTRERRYYRLFTPLELILCFHFDELIKS